MPARRKRFMVKLPNGQTIKTLEYGRFSHIQAALDTGKLTWDVENRKFRQTNSKEITISEIVPKKAKARKARIKARKAIGKSPVLPENSHEF